MNKFHKVSFEEFEKRLSSPYTGEEELKQLYDDIVLPTRSTSGSAGYDFRLPVTINCRPDVLYIIPTGISCEMDEDIVLQIFPRSSLGMKYGFRLENTTGIIDSDYYSNPDNEGHIFVGFRVKEFCTLETGDKFCQGIFLSYYVTDDDEANDVREGGIGSTGV